MYTREKITGRMGKVKEDGGATVVVERESKGYLSEYADEPI